MIAFKGSRGSKVANCPAVFLSYFSLWICYENDKHKYQNDKYKDQMTNTEIKMSQTSRLSVAIN